MTVRIPDDTPLDKFAPDLAAAGWSRTADGTGIFKTLKFKKFPDAIGFMVRAGFAAEARNHHPEWRNVYNRVEVTLTTHDAGGLTEKDFDLARAMEALL